jgi:hypothetical protein
VFEYSSVFYAGDGAFMYSWIDNKARFRDEEQADTKEMEWLTDQSYFADK